MRKYKVTNTTRKERPRSKREQVGHMIHVKPDGKMVAPGRFEMVDELTEGILGLKRAGHARVEAVEDEMISLKALDEQASIERQMAEERRQQASDKKPRASVSKTGFESNEPAEEVEPQFKEVHTDFDKKAMKENKKAEDSVQTMPNTPSVGDVHDGAKNPDGEPNFVVKAKSTSSEAATEEAAPF